MAVIRSVPKSWPRWIGDQGSADGSHPVPFGEVTLDVNMDTLMRVLGTKAANNAGRKTTMMKGAIKARFTPTRIPEAREAQGNDIGKKDVPSAAEVAEKAARLR